MRSLEPTRFARATTARPDFHQQLLLAKLLNLRVGKLDSAESCRRLFEYLDLNRAGSHASFKSRKLGRIAGLGWM
jgi:hypothetical protein